MMNTLITDIWVINAAFSEQMYSGRHTSSLEEGQRAAVCSASVAK